MKYFNKFLFLVISIGIFSSCADDKVAVYEVEKPESLLEYEYLNDYDALKTYVNREANPNFKLGTGVTVSDYLKKGLVYSVVTTNYDDLTAGNAMKHNSVVADDGSMNFGNVTNFVYAAQEAGLSIYGHTLCWHAQQNVKYLNSIIADRVTEQAEPTWVNYINNGDCEGDDMSNFTSTEVISGGMFDFTTEGAGGEGRAIKIENPTAFPNDFDNQFFVVISSPLEQGATYRYKMDVRAESSVSIGSQAHKKPQSYLHWDMVGQAHISTEWKTFEKEFIVSAEQDGTTAIAWGLGLNATTYYFDNISLEKYETQESITKDYVAQADFEDGIAWGGWGNSSTREVVDGAGFDNSKAMKVVNPSATKETYNVQVACDFSEPLIAGETYFLNMKVKGNQNKVIGAAFQKTEGFSGRGDFPSISVSTEWKDITTSVVVSGEDANRFLFNIGHYDGTLWFDDISIYREIKGGSIPLTPEEKADTLTYALDNWIKGMMEATEGYVKAWDVVNEPMSDWPDPYELKSDPSHSKPDDFYWQDYLGKDFARIAISSARQHGGEGQLLFINDYGLEGYGNNKCKGLIEMVKYWESDNKTIIDGIGTQMHVTYSLDADKQKQNEEGVIGMLELLKETGKLIKITELDMGIADVNGTNLKTIELDFDKHMKMADYYKFIIKKYFEIIPVEQQYGITHWSPTDSDPENSFWRKGEPIGLWDAKYNRKPTYGGFAEGLMK